MSSYRFLHQADGRYFWESKSRVPGDSRHEVISCSVDWFWGIRKAKP